MKTLLYIAAIVMVVAQSSVFAVNLELQHTTLLRSGSWKPSRMVKLSESAFCFPAFDAACAAASCPQVLLCSFDGGASVSEVQVSLPFCGARGVLLEEQLFCPHELLPQSSDSVFTYSAISFTAINGNIEDSINIERQFSFTLNSKTEEVKSIEFSGNTVFFHSKEMYMTVVTLVFDDRSRQPALFQSNDGFEWTQHQTLLITPAHEYYLVRSGQKELSIFSHNEKGFEVVSSSSFGKKWKSARAVELFSFPSIVAYPSGVMLEFDGKSQNMTYYVLESADKKVNTSTFIIGALHPNPKVNMDAPMSLSMIPLIGKDLSKLALAYNTVDMNGKNAGLRYALIDIHDKEEYKWKLERIALEEEKERKREERMWKAKQEQMEKQMKERRLRQKKEQERRETFHEADAQNIERAMENLKLDGEMIVVRVVNRSTIDIEKETFF